MRISERDRVPPRLAHTHTPSTVHHCNEAIADWFYSEERKLIKKEIQDEEKKCKNIDEEIER